MRRALILAYYFPPAAASGCLRPVGLSVNLTSHGYQPHIVAADVDSIYPPIGRDESLERFLPPGLVVDRLVHENRLKQLLALRDRLRARVGGGDPQAGAGAGMVGGGDSVDVGRALGRRIKDRLLDRIFSFPDHQRYWIPAALAHAAALTPAQRPDVVMATANPWSSLLAGMRIARRLRVPFVADFRDPWARNPKPQPSAGFLPAVRRLEAKVMASASRVVANTEALGRAFAADHPECAEKIVTVPNGYLEQAVDALPPAIPGPVELCHFGSVYELRNPVRLLAALESATDAGGFGPDQLRVRFVGSWGVADPECEALARRLEGRGLVQRDGSVSRSEASKILASSTHLLVLQQDFPLQIPAKLYEYLPLGRPIVVVGGAGATEELVRTHHLGVCCANDHLALAGFLTELASSRLTLEPPDAVSASGFGYDRVSGRMARVFDEAIAGYGRD